MPSGRRRARARELIAAIHAAELTLVAVYSEDDEGANRIEVVAEVSLMDQADAQLEKVVTAVGLEPAVCAVSRRIVRSSDEERIILAEA